MSIASKTLSLISLRAAHDLEKQHRRDRLNATFEKQIGLINETITETMFLPAEDRRELPLSALAPRELQSNWLKKGRIYK